jgi:hypothetical protein
MKVSTEIDNNFGYEKNYAAGRQYPFKYVMCCEVEKTYLIQLLIVLKFYKFYSTPISFMHILVLFSCWAQSDYLLFIVISWELHRLSIIFNELYQVRLLNFTTHHILKGILSTSCVIFFIPKIIVDFRTDLHKMKINTELCCKRYDFLTKKTQNYRYQNYCLDDNIQIYSYVNTSWACALFRTNTQHVVLGQKRNCQRVEESGLWRIQRERWIEVKYLPNGTS